jgi:hypothetical protein
MRARQGALVVPARVAPESIQCQVRLISPPEEDPERAPLFPAILRRIREAPAQQRDRTVELGAGRSGGASWAGVRI